MLDSCYVICDANKQNESEVEKHDFFFRHFLFGFCLGLNLIKKKKKKKRDWTGQLVQKIQTVEGLNMQ